MTDRIRTATCPLDCPGACALRVVMDDQGAIERIEGDPQHPFTRGVICGKVARYREIQEGERILYPMLRTGAKGAGEFQRVSWEEALGQVADGLQEIIQAWGPQAVYPYYYGGTLGIVQRKAVSRLAHRAGFSRLEGTICFPIAEAGWTAGVGDCIGPDASEMAASDLIILWGINAVSTHINLMTFVKEARGQGARLLVVDPYRNRTARLADVHLAPLPGTDGALARAVMGVILREGLADRNYLARLTDFDAAMEAHLTAATPEWAAGITGLSAQEIIQLGRDIGHARAPFIRMGVGMSRHTNGAVNVHAVACIAALTGAWSRPGGGALFATGGAFRIDDSPVRRPDLLASSGDMSRSLDMSCLGEHLTSTTLDPPIKALLVGNANPAVSCPDAGQVLRGLARDDLFTVVHEQVMSDTARFADVLLPATTFLEHEDLYKSYGQYTLQHAPAILPPRGEARSNHEVVNALARRMGYTDAAFTGGAGERIAAILASSELPPLAHWPGRWLDLTPSLPVRRFEDGFPTADGLFHFYPGWSNPQMPGKPDHWPVTRRDDGELAQRYPLSLITPPAHETLNATFIASAAVRARRGPPVLRMHPQDATARGIVHGQAVAVENDLARLTMTVQVSEDVRAGVVVCEGGYMCHEFPEGLPLNALTHADPTPPDNGPAFHDCRVQVLPL